VRQVSRFNEEQIIDVLRQHEAGARIAASTQRLDRASDLPGPKILQWRMAMVRLMMEVPRP